MSRLKSQSTALTDDPLNDICPVCKSNRYLNPTLQFLINPECYHKMCSTCVDRIFTSGPASCPVVGCGKTLRKKGFHKAFFADLKIERECDIRKRVGAVFNRREDEFESLSSWNDYLEMVEGLIFDLVEGTMKEKAKAEETLRAHRAANAKEIEDNKRAGLEAKDVELQREREEKEAVRQRRLAILREQEEDKLDVEKERREMLERLARGDGDANAITKHAQKVILKKSSARRNLAESNFADTANGRYSMNEYYSRTMFEAFSGLGIFIGDQVVEKSLPAAPATIGTVGAAEAAGGRLRQEMNTDDVF
ncbi:putative RNA polymerase II transcription factor B subunit 3 [Glarea lozoyensis 74030]|uniref:RNA polymerase II transcription factor B subunit 3 n=1 Tax=Glarea lozoyensis (strain ATCC 74030 / MF5533) TaxID=1104152 RepID=H0EK46_GLAL7|nr:putative RNA polymerase II transcription factor B subunit 3 [Glarea lozoyensis 74030]